MASQNINLGRVVGLSVYEIAVRNGYKGTEAQWIADLQSSGGLPVVSSADDGKVLAVENGVWVAAAVSGSTLKNAGGVSF